MTIELKDICKSYGSKRVLERINILFEPHRIHALVGENGAGKSTLAKIISGETEPSGGTMLVDGNPVRFRSPRDALDAGISIVQQRPLLAPELTVAENIFLSSSRSEKSFLRRTFIPRKTPQELLDLKDIWCPDITLDAPVKDSGGNTRFYAALLESLLRRPRCLILDEPSAFLEMDERRKLYESLTDLAGTGTVIIVITHSPAEANTYANKIIHLKEDSVAEDSGKDFFFPTAAEHSSRTFRPATSGRECLRLSGCSCKPTNKAALLDASMECGYGEICAVTGVKESAIDTLEDFVTGMSRARCAGSVTLTDYEGHAKKIPARKLSAGFLRRNGAAIVPSDKTFRASNPRLTVEQMLCAYHTGKDTKNFSMELIRKADVSIKPSQMCADLSGGMLQRLILERELETDPSLIIMCNPMQGLDTKSQAALIARIADLSHQGKSLLLLGAEDFPLTLCSKVYSMEGGTCALAHDVSAGAKEERP
ncbi:MAG: ATP-binding cassette domain-containing protein [Treponema sp.]|nr:ATP-binding cassette domain-containing protein [Treponema sp.]